MNIRSCSSGIDVHDLPPGLSGVCSSDVMLPTGQSVGIHGCSRDAHRLLQEEIDRASQLVPVALPAAVLLRHAVTQFQHRLMEMGREAA